MNINDLNNTMTQQLLILEKLGGELALKSRNFGVLLQIQEINGELNISNQNAVSKKILQVSEFNLLRDTISHAVESLGCIADMANNWQYILEPRVLTEDTPTIPIELSLNV